MTDELKRAPGHCDDDAAWANFSQQYGKLQRKDLGHGDLSDFALANAQYMASRDDLNLIVFQTSAKERIRWLSVKLAEAEALLRSQRDGAGQLGETARLRGACRDHDPSIGAALDWRDISTAPRDGTDLLLICATAYTPTACLGWWGWWNNSEGWQHYSRPEEKSSGGVTRWFPTHWTPVPTLDADPSSAKQVEVPKSRDDVETLKAALAKAVEGLEIAERALTDWYDYQYRNKGTYDGQSEREALVKAQRSVTATLAAIRQEPRG